jgi:hypothetical protein
MKRDIGRVAETPEFRNSDGAVVGAARRINGPITIALRSSWNVMRATFNRTDTVAFAKALLELAGEPVQTEPALASSEEVEEFTRGLVEAERLRHVLEHAVD